LPAVVKPENNLQSNNIVTASSQEEISQAYQALFSSYQWQLFPSNILEKTTQGDTFVCSQLLPVNRYSKVSFLFNIPAQPYLKIGENTINAYIAQISILPEDLKNNDFQDKLTLYKYYSESIPLFIL